MTGSSIVLNNMANNSINPPTTLFVGDLSIFCTENDLLMLFSNFGAMPKVQVKRGKQGEALQYGFVVLPRSVAIEAAERVNGIKFLGRRIRIKLKLSHDSPSIILHERNHSGWAQIHFSFITHQVTHAIGEEMVDRVFSSLGAVADVAIKQHSITIDPPRQTAYGFIFFYEQEAAQRAIQEMKHVQIDGVMFDCNWSNQRDADADSRRKLLARQQTVIAPGYHQEQGSSTQFTAIAAPRRSYSSSPVMLGAGYDLSMAMEGLTIGPAGLTMSQTPMANHPMGMYGPPLPPSPIGLGMPNMNNMAGMDMPGQGMNMVGGMSYHQTPQQHYRAQQQPPQQASQHLGGGMVYMGSTSPQGANSGFFQNISSGSTDSFTSYTNSMSAMQEASPVLVGPMDGSMLQQRGMYMIAPPSPQMPRYHHVNPHLPHPQQQASSGAYGANVSASVRGYVPGGIAAAPRPVCGGGYYVSSGAPLSSATSLSSSPPRPQNINSEQLEE